MNSYRDRYSDRLSPLLRARAPARPADDANEWLRLAAAAAPAIGSGLGAGIGGIAGGLLGGGLPGAAIGSMAGGGIGGGVGHLAKMGLGGLAETNSNDADDSEYQRAMRAALLSGYFGGR